MLSQWGCWKSGDSVSVGGGWDSMVSKIIEGGGSAFEGDRMSDYTAFMLSIDQAIDGLNETDRDIMYLEYVRHVNGAGRIWEKSLGFSEGYYGQRRSRARKKIRESLKIS